LGRQALGTTWHEGHNSSYDLDAFLFAWHAAENVPPVAIHPGEHSRYIFSLVVMAWCLLLLLQ
jgi:hypothetical protein